MESPITRAKIDALIARLGTNQQGLADLLGCRQGLVSKWRNGDDVPSERYAVKLREMIARMADLTTEDAVIEAAFAWEGESPIRRAMERAEEAGLSPLAMMLAGSAIRAHDAGERQVDWIMAKQHVGQARLEVEVARLHELGLWPW